MNKNVTALLLFLLSVSSANANELKKLSNDELLQMTAESLPEKPQYDFGIQYQYVDGNEIQDSIKLKQWLDAAALQGDAGAEFDLATLYQNSIGIEHNSQLAKQWYEKSAQQGNADAQYALGCYYFYGYAGEQDYAKAKVWYEKAALQGDVRAQLQLGLMFTNGYGVEKDYQQAKSWFDKSVAQNDNRAKVMLGLMYLNGNGVEKNYNDAKSWIIDSAKLNIENDLALMYINNDGSQADYVQAIKLFEVAAKTDVHAKYYLGLMFIQGVFVEPNYVKSTQYFIQACDDPDVGDIPICF